ncbi:MAG: transcriptional regulator [Bacteroidia bacterium]|nr:transcriptional regulator [Bacteroidia bacterium]NNC85169.1 transcriptional regulator [Bacteroidia bacterium]NNM16063.1 transcriptional regulator [Bacteroidia bacterium]
MGKLNTILHQELRLAIISFLANVDYADFKKLIEVTGASKGNLSVQITKLQEAGYIKVKKSFKNNYPHTNCALTAQGKKEFEIYLKELKEMLNI